MQHAPQSETDRNYEAFQAQLPEILPNHAGQFALMHEARIIRYFDNSLSATVAGAKEFGKNRYSVQEVTAEVEHLGFYSYVGGTGEY